MWVVVVSICTSLIIVLVISGSMVRGLLSMGRQSIRKTCRCPATRCCKQPELFRDPPPPPVNKHNRFQYTVPSHIKVVRLIRAGRGSEAKKTFFFVTEGIWQRKPRFNEQVVYAWLWNAHIFVYYLRCQYQISWEIWHAVLVANHLLDTESEFAFWDPSKAQILVATPPHVGTMNSAYWAFSTFQSAFIWAIASVVLWSSFICPLANYPWANLVSSVYICLFPWESFSRHAVFISIYVAKLNKSVWSETRMLSAIG